MNIKDAYFAGLIDGEGCIGLHSNGSNKPKRIVIQVNMTCKKTVNAIHKHFKLGHVRPKKVYGNDKPQWRWKCTSLAAKSVLDKIYPYLICKRSLVKSLRKT